MEEVWPFLYEIFVLLFSFSLYIRLVMLQLLSQSLSWLGNLNGKKMGISEIPPGICRGGCPVGNPRGPTWNQRNRLRNDTLSKKGCLKTWSRPILSAGSYVSIAWIKPKSCSCSSWSDCWYFLSDLQFSRTYFPAELCSSHTSFPAWKYFVFVRRDIEPGKGPKDLLHHGEMLPVVMSLEEGEPKVELKHDAPYAPNVAWL